MTIELNRRTFRRILIAYIWVMIISLIAVVTEAFVYLDFSNDFDALNARYFGVPSDRDFVIFGLVSIPALIAHIGAIIGMLRFRPWSRPAFWITIVVGLMPLFIPSLSVTWTGPWLMWLEFLGGALFGMIVLLSYAQNLGTDWFNAQSAVAKVENDG